MFCFKPDLIQWSSASSALALTLFVGCAGGGDPSPTPEESPTGETATPTASPVTPTGVPVTPTAVPVTPTEEPETPTVSPITPTPAPPLEDQIRAQLEAGRWSSENYEKLVTFFLTYSDRNPERPVDLPFAVFDADKTMWGGDQGEASFVYMIRNLKFSADLASALPTKLTVPAGSLGASSASLLFPRQRLQDATAAMLVQYQAVVDSAATAQGFLDAFDESMLAEGGVLATNTSFKNAYQVYTGTLTGLYLLLDSSVGPVGFDYADSRDATELYAPHLVDFYTWETTSGGNKLASFYQDIDGDGAKDILFPAILDGSADQLSYQEAGKLGSYAQVAVWEVLGKTPAEVRAQGEAAYAAYPLGQSIAAVFPLDEAGATSPVPLDFSVDASLFVAGASPATGVVMGSTSFGYGNVVRPEIVNLMEVMELHGITVTVVSASEENLVEAMAEPLYGVPTEHIIGLTAQLGTAGYENWLLNPVTYRPGKVDAVFSLADDITGDPDSVPVFCAGDSNTDFEFVAYSSDFRLFFDRAKNPLMELAHWLTDNGYASSTLIQAPFEN